MVPIACSLIFRGGECQMGNPNPGQLQVSKLVQFGGKSLWLPAHLFGLAGSLPRLQTVFHQEPVQKTSRERPLWRS